MATLNPVAVTFEHILVPTDFSDISRRALEYAKQLAGQGNSELLLVHVNPPLNMITPPEAAWIDVSGVESLREEQLNQSGAELRSEGYRAQAISLSGLLQDELLSAVKQYKIDLIVLGTHGKKGLERLMLGSDAEVLLRHAHCPVLLVGPAVTDLGNRKWRLREVICATTFDPNTAEVAAYAHKLATLHGGELVLFHVRKPGSEDDIDWVAFEQAFRHYVPEGLGTSSWLRTRLAEAAPGMSIVELARQHGSDLIVMGAHSASAMATHLAPGTVAKVVREATCPVLTLLQP